MKKNSDKILEDRGKRMDAKSQPCRDDLEMGRKRWVMKEVMSGC